MTHLETELKKLKDILLEMTDLTLSQLKKAKEAYLNMDVDLAHEILHNEIRLNAFELSIDRDCENILALFNPVASDLRYVIAVLKTNSDLERIGDYTETIASYVIEFNTPTSKLLIEATKLPIMFDIAISMVQDIRIAFEKEDVKLARKVYQKDAKLNIINKDASRVLSQFIKEDPEIVRPALFLFSTIRKLERVGDHVKNIVEELIFFMEAAVLKHQKIAKK